MAFEGQVGIEKTVVTESNMFTTFSLTTLYVVNWYWCLCQKSLSLKDCNDYFAKFIYISIEFRDFMNNYTNVRCYSNCKI